MPIRVLRQALIRRSTATGFEDWLRDRYGTAVFEKALADRPEIDQCSGPKGFHEWKAPKTISKGFAGKPIMELRACQHCSVHLLTDHRGYAKERTDLFFSEPPEPEWDLLSFEADPHSCRNRTHEEGMWYEFCPECGVTNP